MEKTCQKISHDEFMKFWEDQQAELHEIRERIPYMSEYTRAETLKKLQDHKNSILASAASQIQSNAFPPPEDKTEAISTGTGPGENREGQQAASSTSSTSTGTGPDEESRAVESEGATPDSGGSSSGGAHSGGSGNIDK